MSRTPFSVQSQYSNEDFKYVDAPYSLTFTPPKQSMEKRNVKHTITPSNSKGTYTSGELTIFDLPALPDEFTQKDKTLLKFFANESTAGNPKLPLSNFIEQIQVLNSAGKEMHDKLNIQQLQAILRYLTPTDYQSTIIDKREWNYQSTTPNWSITNNNMAKYQGQTGVVYTYDLSSLIGILSPFDKLIPSGIMGVSRSNSWLTIRIKWAQASTIYNGGGTLEISRPMISFRNIVLNSDYSKLLRQYLDTGGFIQFGYSEYHSFVQTGITQDNIKLNLTRYYKSLQYVMFCVNSTALATANPTYDPFTISLISSEDLQKFQCDLGGEYYPPQAVDNTTTTGSGVLEWYDEIIETLNINGHIESGLQDQLVKFSSNAGGTALTNNTKVIGLVNFSKEISGDIHINGKNTNGSNLFLELFMNLAGTNVNVYTWQKYDVLCTITRDAIIIDF